MSDLLGPNFEDNIALIDRELGKHRGEWTLTSIQWAGWDDVAQLVRIHIYNKWGKFDKSKAFVPWLRKVISHKIKNIVRNLYGNYARPCLKCKAAVGETGCKIYSSQCSKCPLYAAWETGRKRACDINMPVPIEFHLNEEEYSSNSPSYTDTQDIDKSASIIHKHMRTVLKATEWRIYDYLFVKNLDDDIIAKKLGFKADKGHASGFKQIRHWRGVLVSKVKEEMSKENIDII